MSEMPENVAILLAFLVAANVVLLVVVLGRTAMRRRRMAGSEALKPTIAATTLPQADHRAIVEGIATTDRAPARRDALTGLMLPTDWNRIVIDEDARYHRYGRPATVVLIELDGLDRLVATLGQPAADKVLPAVGDTFRRHARGADHVARLGPGRFGVLLPETDEVDAVNYVERVRQACDLWLESGAIALRLAIGWASPAGETGVAESVAIAQDRMFDELRRSARRATDPADDETAPAPGLESSPAPA